MKIDVDELIHAKVIDQETATRITNYYQAKQGSSQKSNLVRLVSIIGVIMVGLGLLLIVAYNWDQMPKPLKLTLAILPLLMAQSVGLYTLLKKHTSLVWKESSSLAILFGVGIALALIMQIYQLDYTLAEYLKWWIILSIALIYVFDSSVTSCAIWIGIAWYLSDSSWSDGSYNIWMMLGILFAAVLPYIRKLISKQSQAGWAWHHWIVPLVLVQFVFTLNPFVCSELTMIHIVITLLIYDSICKVFLETSSAWSNGYRVISFTGIAIIAFVMSFKYFWIDSTHPNLMTCAQGSHWLIPAVFGVFLILMMFYKILYERDPFRFILPGVGILLIGLIIIAPWAGSAGRIIVNLTLLAAAGLLIYRGVSTGGLATVNLGIVLLGIWVICRFFESDISFIWRGVIFILLGLFCFLINYSLIRKKSS